MNDALEIRKLTIQRSKGVDKKVMAYERRMDDEPIDGFRNIRLAIFMGHRPPAAGLIFDHVHGTRRRRRRGGRRLPTLIFIQAADNR